MDVKLIPSVITLANIAVFAHFLILSPSAKIGEQSALDQVEERLLEFEEAIKGLPQGTSVDTHFFEVRSSFETARSRVETRLKFYEETEKPLILLAIANIIAWSAFSLSRQRRKAKA